MEKHYESKQQASKSREFKENEAKERERERERERTRHSLADCDINGFTEKDHECMKYSVIENESEECHSQEV